MTTYFRISDARRLDLADAYFAALAPNKRADLRVFVDDPRPTPAAGEVVVALGIVVGAIEAHQTYGVRPKTADELEADALATERPAVAALVADLQTQIDIDNNAFNAMTTADKLVVIRTDRRILLRVARYLLRDRLRATPSQ